MLEKASHDAAHPDAIAHPAHARPQRAAAAHDEIDFNPRLRGAVERLDNALIEQAVHLGNDASGLALARMLGLAGNQVKRALGKIERRDQQRAVIRPLGIGGQKTKDPVHRGGDIFIGGEQAQIGVKPGGGGVVVARTQVSVAAGDAIGVATGDERQLGMRLQSYKAVEDLHAGIFEAPGPADV